jgi:hypothetical protein
MIWQMIKRKYLFNAKDSWEISHNWNKLLWIKDPKKIGIIWSHFLSVIWFNIFIIYTLTEIETTGKDTN